MQIRPSAKMDYPGKDLEAMSFAENYHQWILEEFQPFIGKSVAEVGAGCGNFTKMLLKTALENLVAYEPSLQIFPMLTASIEGESRVEAINEFFGAGSAGGFDSILYINVLEHIENDKAELAIMRDKLVPDGHVLIFVPALPALFSDFDKSIGHYRRYRKVQLADTLRESGFSIEKIKYFDCAGILPCI
jgi:2-polyprenyl-3-methyl-5-hydroxy-6-metoxy-1,4-benzoquinol methylase